MGIKKTKPKGRWGRLSYQTRLKTKGTCGVNMGRGDPLQLEGRTKKELQKLMRAKLTT